MDHDTNDTQGRPSGGGMQTRSRAASGKRSRGRAKKATPSGPRGPRAPASTADTTPGGVTNAETLSHDALRWAGAWADDAMANYYGGYSIEAFRSHARLMVQPTAVLPQF